MYCLLSRNLALVYNSRKRKLSLGFLEVGMYVRSINQGRNLKSSLHKGKEGKKMKGWEQYTSNSGDEDIKVTVL